MYLKIVSLTSLLFVSGMQVNAQSASAIQANANTVQLSLTKAVEIALQHNLNVKSYEVSLRNAQLQFQQSKNNALPNLSANINQSASFGRSINPFTNGYDSRNINYNNLGLNAGMLLFNGGQIRNTVLQNDYNLKASQEDLASIKENISLQVVLAYLAILNSEDQLSIAKTQTEITKLQITRTEKLVNAGSLAPSNLLDLKAQLASEESNVVNFQSSLDLNKLTLIQLLIDSSITAIELHRIQVPAPSTSGYDTGIEDLYAKALAIQPLVKAADLRVQSALKGISVAKAGTLPTLSFSASMSANQSNALTMSYFDQLNNTQNKVLSVGLNIPIFTRFAAKTRIAQASLQRENASIEAAKARQNLRQNIEQAYVNLNNAAMKYEAGLSQVSALEESFRAAESRFGAGTIDFVSYNLQKTNLDKARLSLIQSKYDFVFRTKILDFYQGKSLTF
ncbi:MAG: TolC family protein [Aquirufa sp.]